MRCSSLVHVSYANAKNDHEMRINYMENLLRYFFKTASWNCILNFLRRDTYACSGFKFMHRNSKADTPSQQKDTFSFTLRNEEWRSNEREMLRHLIYSAKINFFQFPKWKIFLTSLDKFIFQHVLTKRTLEYKIRKMIEKEFAVQWMMFVYFEPSERCQSSVNTLWHVLLSFGIFRCESMAWC